ncbi:MAG TPA: hypothetical protein PLP42_02280 [Acidobacteriota bacterium]|jgi:hypothetical protein|nr:hypothetical protein [Acidobacteriota bacterium]
MTAASGWRLPGSGLLLVVLAASVFANDVVTVRSERLRVSYDEDFGRRIEWSLAAARDIVAFDPSLDEGPLIGGQLVRFSPDPARNQQKRVVDPEFGPVLELTIIGVCKDRPDLVLERVTRVQKKGNNRE